jgi:hypothetical protein
MWQQRREQGMAVMQLSRAAVGVITLMRHVLQLKGKQ